MKKFLDEVHEFKTGKVKFVEWCDALGIASCQLEPEGNTVDVIKTAIAERDSKMRKEIIDFVQGTRIRQDIVEEAQGDPILVYYNYKHEFERIKAAFPNVKTLDTQADRRKWNAGEYELVACHPASVGR